MWKNHVIQNIYHSGVFIIYFKHAWSATLNVFFNIYMYAWIFKILSAAIQYENDCWAESVMTAVVSVCPPMLLLY